jgi:hypothetical protein
MEYNLRDASRLKALTIDRETTPLAGDICGSDLQRRARVLLHRDADAEAAEFGRMRAGTGVILASAMATPATLVNPRALGSVVGGRYWTSSACWHRERRTSRGSGYLANSRTGLRRQHVYAGICCNSSNEEQIER